MSTKRPDVSQFGCNSKVGQTTAVNWSVSLSPCAYQYCIRSVCVQQGWKRGVQSAEADDLNVSDWTVQSCERIGYLPRSRRFLITLFVNLIRGQQKITEGKRGAQKEWYNYNLFCVVNFSHQKIVSISTFIMIYS